MKSEELAREKASAMANSSEYSSTDCIHGSRRCFRKIIS
jgi:hypothetical protein